MRLISLGEIRAACKTSCAKLFDPYTIDDQNHVLVTNFVVSATHLVSNARIIKRTNCAFLDHGLRGVPFSSEMQDMSLPSCETFDTYDL